MTRIFLFRWLKAANRHAALSPARRCRDRAHRAGPVPRLEILEDRGLPSTLVVTNALDTGAAGDGSLRGEIAAAAGGDRIVFAPSLSSCKAEWTINQAPMR